MVKDLTKIIKTLRSEAVGRCRERIEQAANKTKEVFNTQNPAAKNTNTPPCSENGGVTSLLKRRHGL